MTLPGATSDVAIAREKQALRRRGAVKRAYLANLARYGNHSLASDAAGVNRTLVYKWLDQPEFAAAYEHAQEEATERLEAEAWRRAVEGTEYIRRAYWKGEVCGEDIRREYSDNLLMLLLRARAPNKYREGVNVDIRQVVKVVAGVDPREVLGSNIGSGQAALNSPGEASQSQ